MWPDNIYIKLAENDEDSWHEPVCAITSTRSGENVAENEIRRDSPGFLDFLVSAASLDTALRCIDETVKLRTIMRKLPEQ
ncbi:hypothetical protein WN48_03564 [Eufriesea mexicana]|nr:hypothetical protein WN48_03564 [Eufriesea mexicana]